MIKSDFVTINERLAGFMAFRECRAISSARWQSPPVFTAAAS